MDIRNIIFDLDGTLIDSSQSILSAFQASFESLGVKPTRSFTREIIGPPLKETLALVAGTEDHFLLDELAAAFKTHYDTEAYLQTAAFPDVEKVLVELVARGLSLYIATNKRIKPTRLIIDHLDWEKYFAGVYALDALEPPAKDKGNLLGCLLSINLIQAKNALYVGDRNEDMVAASRNGVLFAHAKWGYETTYLHNEVEGIQLQNPMSLLDIDF